MSKLAEQMLFLQCGLWASANPTCEEKDAALAELAKDVEVLKGFVGAWTALLANGMHVLKHVHKTHPELLEGVFDED